MKFGVVNKSTTVNRFVIHTLQRNITHLAVITRKTNIKLGSLKGGTGKEQKITLKKLQVGGKGKRALILRGEHALKKAQFSVKIFQKLPQSAFFGLFFEKFSENRPQPPLEKFLRTPLIISEYYNASGPCMILHFEPLSSALLHF